MYNPGAKINKQQMREVFPSAVQQLVFDLMKTKRTRNVKVFAQSEGWQLYLDEGARYTFFHNDERREVSMQAQHSLHAGGHPTSYRVAERMALPVGTWVVECKLFLGKPFINVHNVGLAALPAHGQ